MKICFDTFGCRLNRAEALKDEAHYLAAGFTRTERHSDADIIVVRGCSVTARAQRDCEKMIAHLKRKYPGKQLLITGCLKDAKPTPLPRLGTAQQSPVPTRTARAYLKIQDGCNSNCTFCIVPKFRGKAVSTDFAKVLDEAQRFIDKGYHEIVVTGCNLAQYLSDGKRLPDVLAALANLSTATRIRLGSVEPGACAREVVSVMAEHANICRFLHLPIQSGSDLVLAAMKRPYDVSDITALVDEALRKMPKLGLGCDLMTGFPGETELDHRATIALIRRLPFTNAHIFPYSERPETPAAKMIRPVAKTIRSARARELSDLINDKRKLFARMMVGQQVEVLIENEEKHLGWTGEYLPCEVKRLGNGAPIRRKELVRAKVIGEKSGCLVATQLPSF